MAYTSLKRRSNAFFPQYQGWGLPQLPLPAAPQRRGLTRPSVVPNAGQMLREMRLGGRSGIGGSSGGVTPSRRMVPMAAALVEMADGSTMYLPRGYGRDPSVQPVIVPEGGEVPMEPALPSPFSRPTVGGGGLFSVPGELGPRESAVADFPPLDVRGARGLRGGGARTVAPAPRAGSQRVGGMGGADFSAPQPWTTGTAPRRPLLGPLGGGLTETLGPGGTPQFPGWTGPIGGLAAARNPFAAPTATADGLEHLRTPPATGAGPVEAIYAGRGAMSARDQALSAMLNDPANRTGARIGRIGESPAMSRAELGIGAGPRIISPPGSVTNTYYNPEYGYRTGPAIGGGKLNEVMADRAAKDEAWRALQSAAARRRIEQNKSGERPYESDEQWQARVNRRTYDTISNSDDRQREVERVALQRLRSGSRLNPEEQAVVEAMGGGLVAPTGTPADRMAAAPNLLAGSRVEQQALGRQYRTQVAQDKAAERRLRLSLRQGTNPIAAMGTFANRYGGGAGSEMGNALLNTFLYGPEAAAGMKAQELRSQSDMSIAQMEARTRQDWAQTQERIESKRIEAETAAGKERNEIQKEIAVLQAESQKLRDQMQAITQERVTRAEGETRRDVAKIEAGAGPAAVAEKAAEVARQEETRQLAPNGRFTIAEDRELSPMRGNEAAIVAYARSQNWPDWKIKAALDEYVPISYGPMGGGLVGGAVQSLMRNLWY